MMTLVCQVCKRSSKCIGDVSKNTLKRGQVSVEFIIIMSVMLLILLSVIVVMRGRNTEVAIKEEQLRAQVILDNIQNSIRETYVFGNGSNTTYYVPRYIWRDINYSLQIDTQGRFLVANWSSHIVSVPLTYIAVNDTVLQTGSLMYFRNNEGVVEIAYE